MKALISLLAITFAMLAAHAAPKPPTSAEICEAVIVGLLPVNAAELTNHQQEKRGFVSVPLDYANVKSSPKINIFYRLLPAEGSTVDDKSKPIMIIINGGPAADSSHFRALNHDYNSKDELTGRLKYLPKEYRVLLFDQRGTGNSAPLDMKNPNLDPYVIAKLFSGDSIAKDLAAIIQKVVPADERFYVTGQSFGGMVLYQYLANTEKSKSARLPNGVAFAASAIPHNDRVLITFAQRRREQHKINLELAERAPGIKTDILELRKKVREVRPSSTFVDSMYQVLVKDLVGDWPGDLHRDIQKFLKMTPEELGKQIDEGADSVDLLNYILSSAQLTPGYTDKAIAKMFLDTIPFEPWMIDEYRHFYEMQPSDEAQAKALPMLDAKPPEPTPFAPFAQVQRALLKTKVIFTTAADDGAVPMVELKNQAAKILPPHGKVVVLPNGGHGAAFMKDGYRTFGENGFK